MKGLEIENTKQNIVKKRKKNQQQKNCLMSMMHASCVLIGCGITQGRMHIASCYEVCKTSTNMKVQEQKGRKVQGMQHKTST
jgi:hypothetical protein